MPLTLDAAATSSKKDPAKPVTVDVLVGGVSWLGFYPPEQCPEVVRLAVEGDATPGATSDSVRAICVDLTVIKPKLAAPGVGGRRPPGPVMTSSGK